MSPMLQYFPYMFFLSSLLLFYHVASHDSELSWSRRAAKEAEVVAAISCSGHGRAYVDGVLENGLPVCECNKCYAGPDCSKFLSNCSADSTSGDPLFLEPYWKRHAESSAVLISGWHRMSYSADGKSYIVTELEKHIRLLHKVIGNAVADDKHIVFGTGSTQLLNAAVLALSPDNETASVVAKVPYYPAYRTQTLFFRSKVYEWEGATSNWSNSSTTTSRKKKHFIEFVTSPNNPDGFLVQKPTLGGSSVIYDHAYYWPHFTAIRAPADEDVMLFTISKVTGHAGSRFGWALIRNATVHNRTVEYVGLNTQGVSRDTQLRALKLIKTLIAEAGRKGDIFQFGYRSLRERWRELNRVVSSTTRFSLQKLVPEHCSYFEKIRDPSPAYAWLKCEEEEDKDCYKVVIEGGITPRAGTLFGADSRYVRLSLIRSQDDFDLLLQRMEALVGG